ncbi:hypothetical protein TRVA0_011S02916 [Trichomonascus vanleenenianus]|uniref:mitochondrial 54S ribosomal protein mL67 MHR1 n=1 Tax=Trichomonascus vanleenenianus TaxID=2268995 RepID=UPI003EC99676
MPGFTQRAGKYRTPTWLRKHRYGPNVFVFRNLETNQVLYTQTPFPQPYNIRKQFQNPNWQNRLPSTRNDLWRAMAVAQLPTYEKAVDLYESLVQLRHMRDWTHRDQAMAWRKTNEDGNIWYSSQFRPTYTQEAVADIISALEHVQPAGAKIHWEDAWRRGESEHWQSVEVEHTEMPRYNPRERFVVLRDIADNSYTSFFQSLIEQNRAHQQLLVRLARERAEAREQGKPLPDMPPAKLNSYRLQQNPSLESQIMPKLKAKGQLRVERDGPGGPSRKMSVKQLSQTVHDKKKQISELMARAYGSNYTLQQLPNYGHHKLRRRIKAEALQEFAVLRRVQKQMERYKDMLKKQRLAQRAKRAKKLRM